MANLWNSTFQIKKHSALKRLKVHPNGLKVSRFKAKSTRKQSKADLWRTYGLTRPPKPRYEGLKGVYWRILSELVRRRDFERYRACISCGRTVFDWKDCDAGHFIPASAGGFSLLFDPLNIHLQHKSCNNPVWTPEASLGYERGLDERYGAGTAQGLKERFYASKRITPMKEWSQLQYHTKILALQAELAHLEKSV